MVLLSPFFSLSPSGPLRAVDEEGGYLRLWRCHLAWGSTCAPEVLILILNRLDTKTNKLSRLHQTSLRNDGHGEGRAITAANLWSPKLAPFPSAPSHAQFQILGSPECAWLCPYVCVWTGSEKGLWEKFPPPSWRKGRQHQGD